MDRLTHHTTVIQDVLQCTPSRHTDHSKLRIYLNEFWHILSTVNKDHKNKGHRKVAEKQIMREGYITEILPNNDRKLRQAGVKKNWPWEISIFRQNFTIFINKFRFLTKFSCQKTIFKTLITGCFIKRFDHVPKNEYEKE